MQTTPGSLGVDFLGSLCVKEECNFPVSVSQVACSPGAEEQQPCSWSSPSAKEQFYGAACADAWWEGS